MFASAVQTCWCINCGTAVSDSSSDSEYWASSGSLYIAPTSWVGLLARSNFSANFSCSNLHTLNRAITDCIRTSKKGHNSGTLLLDYTNYVTWIIFHFSGLDCWKTVSLTQKNTQFPFRTQVKPFMICDYHLFKIPRLTFQLGRPTLHVQTVRQTSLHCVSPPSIYLWQTQPHNQYNLLYILQTFILTIYLWSSKSPFQEISK